MPRGYNTLPTPDNPEGGWHYKPKTSKCPYCQQDLTGQWPGSAMKHLHSHPEYEAKRQSKQAENRQAKRIERMLWLLKVMKRCNECGYAPYYYKQYEELYSTIKANTTLRYSIYQSMALVGTHLTGETCPLPIRQDSERRSATRVVEDWLSLLPPDKRPDYLGFGFNTPSI